ncbi:MAG: type IX secretion system periplasmic lipoprotein PorW/SprE [bacterium]
MKKQLLFILVAFAIVSTGCSRKKDKFINRAWHSVGTEYNILYNGNNALEKGRVSLNQSYQDNYWEILPIERMQVEEEISLPGKSKNADFERAEEKAVKAIQKHSMNIQGKERNPQMDEAYLLLGKARYFDQRFVPALEAFNYILFKYPASDKINQAKIWREKANLRLENDQLALDNLKKLIRRADIEKQDLADATATLAQAYINLQALDSAAWQLEIASTETKNNDELGRYRFIQGQLYNALGHKDSANIAFDKVIDLNRKTPRVYMISAHIEKIKNFEAETGDKLAMLELLTELEENRENRPFLDRIFHQIGEFHRNDNSDSIAISYYNKSLRTTSKDKLLRARNYSTLGDMSFDNAKYRVAGAYYDSTLTNLKERSKPYRAIKRKRDNLADVIYYEDIAVRNDSILTLVAMSDEEKLDYFTAFTDELKVKVEEERKAAEEAEQRAKARQASTQGLANNNAALVSKRSGGKGVGGPPSIGAGSDQNSFYFYNQTTISFGKNEFTQTWGQRQLTDNWRWSESGASIGATAIDAVIANASEDEMFDPDFYISQIPTKTSAIDSLNKDRNFAYYQLGLIYKDKFKELELAKDKLQKLLKNNPEDRLVLPSKYNLYKIYLELNLNDEAEIAKNDIIKNHPDSRYAAILLNPGVDLGEDENSPENIYERLYRDFQNQQYESVVAEADKYITLFDGEAIVPKFEFLKAVSKARLYGLESYKEALNFIALNYPNSEEGKKAENIVTNSLPLLSSTDFVDEEASKNFKVVYQFESDERNEIEDFKKELDSAVVNIKYFDLSTSVDRYNANTSFVIVHGLRSIQGAQGFAEILNEPKEVEILRPSFAISSENYQIIQLHKNLEAYLKPE